MKKRQPETGSSSMPDPLPMSPPPKGRPLLQKSLVVLSLGVFGCAEKAKTADEDVKPEINANANAESLRQEPPAPIKVPEKPILPAEAPPPSPFLQGAGTPPAPIEATPPPTDTPQLVATTVTTTKTPNGVATVKPPPTSEIVLRSPPPHPAPPPHPGGWGDRLAPHPPPPPDWRIKKAPHPRDWNPNGAPHPKPSDEF